MPHERHVPEPRDLSQSPPFSWAAISSNCWVSLLHALLMHFLWGAPFLEALATFSFMRPVHSTTLFAWVLSVLFLDPHEYNGALLDVTALDKAIVAFVSFVGALGSIRVVVALFLLLSGVLAFLWGHALEAAFLLTIFFVTTAMLGEIADVAIQDAKYHIENFTWYARNEYWSGRPYMAISLSLYRTWDALLAYERRLTTGKLIPRLFGSVPYAELPPFVFSPISPSSQIRLLEIKRRRFFSLPTATLTVYNIGSDNIPPFEAISFSPTTQPNIPHLPIVLGNKRHSVPSDIYAILHRLSTFFTPRVIWINALCIDHTDHIEAGLEKETTKWALGNSRRALVCLGESPTANLGISVINTLIIILWNSDLGSAVESFHDMFLFEERPEEALQKTSRNDFLAFLDHPWFQDAEQFEEVLGCAAEVTFCYGNEMLMEAYLMQIGSIFEACDEERVKAALSRPGEIVSWPPRAVPLFIAFMRAKRERESMQDGEALDATG